MALLLLDLDGFRAVNETHGRTAGDALLRAVAARLEAAVREGDRLARIGADEFALLVEDAESPRDVATLARKVTAAFAEPFQAGGRQLSITASVGITVCPADGKDGASVLDNANIALSKARQQGGNQFKFFTEGMHERIVMFERLAADLRRAAEQSQFELVYEPQMRLADHRVEAVEAQLRWNSPEHGVLGPTEFMPVAEQSGSGVSIGMWMLEEVCRQLKRWEAAAVPVPRVAIDVSAAQLEQPGFPEAVRRMLETHSVDPELIELELDERALTDVKQTQAVLNALRDVGVRLAVDDFGEGHLRLTDLQRYPLDLLKIAAPLIADLETSRDDQVVCGVLLSVAHGFQLHAVANGVKSAQQEAFLARHDCLYGQGDFYGAPIDAEQVAALMAKSGGQATRRRRLVRKRIAARAG
jgi:diguanylate cyclase (GGDEF)-like protein